MSSNVSLNFSAAPYNKGECSRVHRELVSPANYHDMESDLGSILEKLEMTELPFEVLLTALNVLVEGEQFQCYWSMAREDFNRGSLEKKRIMRLLAFALHTNPPAHSAASKCQNICRGIGGANEHGLTPKGKKLIIGLLIEISYIDMVLFKLLLDGMVSVVIHCTGGQNGLSEDERRSQARTGLILDVLFALSKKESTFTEKARNIFCQLLLNENNDGVREDQSFADGLFQFLFQGDVQFFPGALRHLVQWSVEAAIEQSNVMLAIGSILVATLKDPSCRLAECKKFFSEPFQEFLSGLPTHVGRNEKQRLMSLLAKGDHSKEGGSFKSDVREVCHDALKVLEEEVSLSEDFNLRFGAGAIACALLYILAYHTGKDMLSRYENNFLYYSERLLQVTPPDNVCGYEEVGPIISNAYEWDLTDFLNPYEVLLQSLCKNSQCAAEAEEFVKCNLKNVDAPLSLLALLPFPRENFLEEISTPMFKVIREYVSNKKIPEVQRLACVAFCLDQNPEETLHGCFTLLSYFREQPISYRELFLLLSFANTVKGAFELGDELQVILNKGIRFDGYYFKVPDSSRNYGVEPHPVFPAFYNAFSNLPIMDKALYDACKASLLLNWAIAVHSMLTRFGEAFHTNVDPDYRLACLDVVGGLHSDMTLVYPLMKGQPNKHASFDADREKIEQEIDLLGKTNFPEVFGDLPKVKKIPATPPRHYSGQRQKNYLERKGLPSRLRQTISAKDLDDSVPKEDKSSTAQPSIVPAPTRLTSQDSCMNLLEYVQTQGVGNDT